MLALRMGRLSMRAITACPASWKARNSRSGTFNMAASLDHFLQITQQPLGLFHLPQQSRVAAALDQCGPGMALQRVCQFGDVVGQPALLRLRRRDVVEDRKSVV